MRNECWKCEELEETISDLKQEILFYKQIVLLNKEYFDAVRPLVMQRITNEIMREQFSNQWCKAHADGADQHYLNLIKTELKSYNDEFNQINTDIEELLNKDLKD